jgi:hypothetical protein
METYFEDRRKALLHHSIAWALALIAVMLIGTIIF